MNWGRGTSDNCNSNGAHRSQGTPAHTAHTILSRTRAAALAQTGTGQTTDRQQEKQEEDDGRPCLWASCRHVCLIKATRRCRLPCLLSAIAGADVACACAWPHGRGSCCVPSGSCSWAHALVHRQKQTNRQTDRETDKETQQQQTQFAIEAATIGGSNGGNIVAAAADQEWAWASGVDLCVPHEERSRVRPQSR